MAYWAEGTKQKPWTPSNAVKFINSDSGMIRLFLSWCRMLGVDEDDLIFVVNIHESADIEAANACWAAVVGVDLSRLSRPQLKRHNPSPRRLNTGGDYHGCLVVRVRRSTNLNRRIAGWWQGLTQGLTD